MYQGNTYMLLDGCGNLHDEHARREQALVFLRTSVSQRKNKRQIETQMTPLLSDKLNSGTTQKRYLKEGVYRNTE